MTISGLIQKEFNSKVSIWLRHLSGTELNQTEQTEGFIYSEWSRSSASYAQPDGVK